MSDRVGVAGVKSGLMSVRLMRIKFNCSDWCSVLC